MEVIKGDSKPSKLLKGGYIRDGIKADTRSLDPKP